MKKAIFPVFLAVGAAALSFVITRWVITAQAENEAGFRVSVLEMQKEFERNNAILRPISDSQGRPDLQKYLTEVNVLTSWFFKNPAKKVWDTYAEAYNPERIIAEHRARAEEEGKHQRSAKGNLPIREECYKLTREIYDSFKGGNYKAVASQFKGSIRLDLHALKLDEDMKLHWNMVVWGGIGDIVYDGMEYKLFKAPTQEELDDYQKELKRAKRRREEPELKDPATLHFAQGTSGSKSPSLPLFEGSDYIDDFPARAQINYYKTMPLHADAEKVVVTIKLKARAMAGEDQLMEYLFELPVEKNWTAKGSWENVKKVETTSDYQ